MQPSGADLLTSFLPLFVIMIPMAIGAAYLAPKMGASRPLWVILFLIPFVNFVAVYVFWFRVAGAILDRLNMMNEKVK
jgi:hypothetical protein